MSPTSVLRGVGPVDPRQFAYPPSYRPPSTLIAVHSEEALGVEMGAISSTWTSAAWGLTNVSTAYPFVLGDYFLVRKVWWMNGNTATTDSADVGVYTEGGTRLVSGGGTAISNADKVQEVDVTDTLLPPGRYWCAYAQNGTTATPMLLSGAVQNLRALGFAQMATNYPLGSTFTPAAIASASVPLCGIANRTQVA